MIEKVIYSAKNKRKRISLPLFLERIKAGFPSPAEGYLDKTLDLNDLLIKNPPATFFLRVEGDSMEKAGITSGDLVIVDRAKTPQNGNIIIAVLNGELTIKRMKIVDDNIVELVPESDNYKSITVTKEMDFEVWGVVSGCVRQF